MRSAFLSECLSALFQTFRRDAKSSCEPGCAACHDPKEESIAKRIERPSSKAFWQRRTAGMRLHDADIFDNNQDGGGRR
jgi:hypothetical protein